MFVVSQKVAVKLFVSVRRGIGGSTSWSGGGTVSPTLSHSVPSAIIYNALIIIVNYNIRTCSTLIRIKPPTLSSVATNLTITIVIVIIISNTLLLFLLPISLLNL